MEVERLISALQEIKRHYGKDTIGMLENEYIPPKVVMPPQEAFYAPKESVMIKDAKGRICSEFVMCYPPGIPILAPGEMITDDIIRHILYSKEKGCFMTGTQDMNVERIQTVKVK